MASSAQTLSKEISRLQDNIKELQKRIREMEKLLEHALDKTKDVQKAMHAYEKEQVKNSK